MISKEKRNLFPTLRGIDFLFSNLLKNGYDIEVILDKEDISVLNYLKEK